MKDFFMFLGIIVVVVFTGGGIIEGGYLLTKTFSPLYEQARYDTFKQSAAYIDSMIRDLDNLVLQYNAATGDSKIALKQVILQRFAAFDVSRLPNRLQLFYSQIQNGIN